MRIQPINTNQASASICLPHRTYSRKQMPGSAPRQYIPLSLVSHLYIFSLFRRGFRRCGSTRICSAGTGARVALRLVGKQQAIRHLGQHHLQPVSISFVLSTRRQGEQGRESKFKTRCKSVLLGSGLVYSPKHENATAAKVTIKPSKMSALWN